MANDQTERADLRLNRIWTTAEQEPKRRDELRVVVVESDLRPISLSVTPEGWRGLLIPLRPGEVVSVPQVFRSSSTGALRAEVAQFTAGSVASDSLHVWCRDPQCNDAFTSFSVFLLDRVTADQELDDLLTESHAEFERLLGVSQSIDVPRLTGLIGEMIVLRDAVLIDPGALLFWAGPRGERHDFRHGASAIEVKCSLRSEAKAHRIRISDWDQLEVPEGGELYLHSIRLERVAAGDWSVPRLTAAIKGALNAEGGASLDAMLANSRALAECSLEFSVKERDTYQVVNGFPKLVSSMVSGGKPPGVSAVSYALDLDHAEAFKVEWSNVLARFVRGATDA